MCIVYIYTDICVERERERGVEKRERERERERERGRDRKIESEREGKRETKSERDGERKERLQGILVVVLVQRNRSILVHGMRDLGKELGVQVLIRNLILHLAVASRAQRSK